MVLAQLAQQFESVYVRQHDIQGDGHGMKALGYLQAFGTVYGGCHI